MVEQLVEQDRRRVKRRTAPMLGFKRFATARRTIAGMEPMMMLRKAQVSAAPANDMAAQGRFVASLFDHAA
jgi:transposase-like protein